MPPEFLPYRRISPSIFRYSIYAGTLQNSVDSAPLCHFVSSPLHQQPTETKSVYGLAQRNPVISLRTARMGCTTESAQLVQVQERWGGVCVQLKNSRR